MHTFHIRPVGPSRATRAPTALATILVALVAGCAGAAVPTASPTLPPAAVTVEAHGGHGENLIFTPASFEIKAGDVVRLVDTGTSEHDLTIDVGGGVPTSKAEQHIAVQIHADLVDTTTQAPINLPPGTYKFYCSIDLGNGTGHAKLGMVGTLTVH